MATILIVTTETATGTTTTRVGCASYREAMQVWAAERQAARENFPGCTITYTTETK